MQENRSPRAARLRPGRRLRLGRRLRVGLAAWVGCLGLVGVRLIQVQVAEPAYVHYADSQVEQTVTVNPLRGPILDRNGQILATSLPVMDIYADPKEVRHPEAEASLLGRILHLAQASLLRELELPTTFVYLAHYVNLQVASEIQSQASNLPGIGELPDSERFAPNGNLALGVLGFTGYGGQGLAGLEYQYNKLLSGKPGLEVVPTDPAGFEMPGRIRVLRKPVPGIGLKLSLDTAIQYETEKALGQEILADKAIRGWAEIEDVHTGQILAMASLVRHGNTVVEDTENLPVTYAYEPGSMMKIATFAGALTDHIITPDTVLDVPSHLILGGAYFSDAEPHGNIHLTATQIIARSSNVGTIEIAERLGPQRLVSWFSRLGFGEPTGLIFPGESYGVMLPLSQWSGSSIGSTPIGMQDAVTAQQMLDAYVAVADGGLFVNPRLVIGFVEPDGRVLGLPPSSPRRVMPSWAAEELTRMLEHVATPQGTAPAAAIPGYLVAGKTGTANKLSPKGGYVPGEYIASFVGFVPAQRPAIAAIVAIDDPTNSYGGLAAAPTFSRICRYALQVLKIAPPPGS